MNTPELKNNFTNILIVDDTPANLELLASMLKIKGYKARPALTGQLALQAAKNDPPDLILLDIAMPNMNGFEVCKTLKEDTDLRDIPVIFISGLTETKEKMEAFSSGGVDYITKPFQFEEVMARVATHLKLRRLQMEMKEYNEKLEKIVEAQVREILESQMATIFALAKLAESRDDETGKHLEKVQLICKAIAVNLSKNSDYAVIATHSFIENLYHACPLHDIGKVAIPDNILLKPGKLTPDEFEIMKAHAAFGAETLNAVLEQYPSNNFIKMGIAIARHHHEKWNGTGYPDGISGDSIPLPARIMAVADVYEAVRSKRCYKPSLSHEKTREIIKEGIGNHFDPVIANAFEESHKEIDEIYENITGV
ncbi:MAG: HD domain-containing phosphohydrolase [Spirochaetota bacterium]